MVMMMMRRNVTVESPWIQKIRRNSTNSIDVRFVKATCLADLLGLNVGKWVESHGYPEVYDGVCCWKKWNLTRCFFHVVFQSKSGSCNTGTSQCDKCYTLRECLNTSSTSYVMRLMNVIQV